ncbi:MAG TPA: patatin-like phospholipase family protein [Gemmataceae bacterium]|nr:patatin-like phospholipase family protein [Gemmataceae bacterium]
MSTDNPHGPAPEPGTGAVARTPVPLKQPVRILAVDGGGVGGIMPVRLIERLAVDHPGLLEKTDILAGTSTGGLIALGLGTGLTPTELGAIYQTWIPQIFSRANQRLWPFSLLRAKFRPSGLRRAATAIAGTRTLGQLGKAVVIPVLALERPQPPPPLPSRHFPAGIFLSTAHRLVHNPARAKYHADSWPCVDVALATSAAPTYFPAHRVNSEVLGRWRFWDGGLVANNPAMVAVGEVTRVSGQQRPDVRVLSLGTGYQDTLMRAADWGQARLPIPQYIISAQLDASVGSTAFLMRQLFGRHVIRVSVPLTGKDGFEMDDPHCVDRLIVRTDHYYTEVVQKSRQVIQPDGTTEDLIAWLRANW